MSTPKGADDTMLDTFFDEDISIIAKVEMDNPVSPETINRLPREISDSVGEIFPEIRRCLNVGILFEL